MPNFRDTISIQVFYQIPGILTKKILRNCLYKIEEPKEIDGIVSRLNPVRLFQETQRKATNWLIFELRNGHRLNTDLDQEVGELRITTEEWIREYKIDKEALDSLNYHIRKARPLYEKAYIN